MLTLSLHSASLYLGISKTHPTLGGRHRQPVSSDYSRYFPLGGFEPQHCWDERHDQTKMADWSAHQVCMMPPREGMWETKRLRLCSAAVIIIEMFTSASS